MQPWGWSFSIPRPQLVRLRIPLLNHLETEGRLMRLLHKHTSILLALIVLAFFSPATLAQTIGYTVRSFGDQFLYRVNLTTGAATPVGATGQRLESIALSPTGVLFGINPATDQLVTINTATGAVTAVGPLGLDVGASIVGLAFDCAGNFLMTANANINNQGNVYLFQLNQQTGAATLIGSGNALTGIATRGGVTYGLTAIGNQLGVLTTNPVAFTSIGSLGTISGVFNIGLDFDANGTLFGLTDEGQSNRLFTVNLTTGTATVVGNLTVNGTPAAGFSGLAIAPPQCPVVGGLSTVSAASFRAEVASSSIAAVFGANLANTIATPPSSLPTTLAGVTVKVKDSLGVERDAQLFFVSPGQINLAFPADTADGTATVRVINNGVTAASGTVAVTNVAPGLFGMNGTGQGVAAAVLLRVKSDGTQIYEPVARFDAAQSRFVALPLELGPETDQLFLVLYGTGLRGRNQPTATGTTIGGVTAEVTYSGPQGSLIGLDQVNVRLPRSLAGRGEVNILYTTDGKTANVVTVSVR